MRAPPPVWGGGSSLQSPYLTKGLLYIKTSIFLQSSRVRYDAFQEFTWFYRITR